MKNLNGWKGLAYVSALFMCSVLFLHGAQGPKIQFKEENWNFGNVKHGDALTHVFTFVNEGDSTLTISKVNTSCGCTAALLSKRNILPGDSGELKVTFNTKGFRGKVSKSIYIESNDPLHPKKRLSISAYIDIPPQPVLHIENPHIDFGLILESEEIHGKTRFHNKGQLELVITLIHRGAVYYSRGEKLSFPLSIPPGNVQDVEIIIPSHRKSGLVRDRIMIKSNDPQRPNFAFYLSGYIITKEQLNSLFIKYEDMLD